MATDHRHASAHQCPPATSRRSAIQQHIRLDHYRTGAGQQATTAGGSAATIEHGRRGAARRRRRQTQRVNVRMHNLPGNGQGRRGQHVRPFVLLAVLAPVAGDATDAPAVPRVQGAYQQRQGDSIVRARQQEPAGS